MIHLDKEKRQLVNGHLIFVSTASGVVRVEYSLNTTLSDYINI